MAIVGVQVSQGAEPALAVRAVRVPSDRSAAPPPSTVVFRLDAGGQLDGAWLLPPVDETVTPDAPASEALVVLGGPEPQVLLESGDIVDRSGTVGHFELDPKAPPLARVAGTFVRVDTSGAMGLAATGEAVWSTTFADRPQCAAYGEARLSVSPEGVLAVLRELTCVGESRAFVEVMYLQADGQRARDDFFHASYEVESRSGVPVLVNLAKTSGDVVVFADPVPPPGTTTEASWSTTILRNDGAVLAQQIPGAPIDVVAGKNSWAILLGGEDKAITFDFDGASIFERSTDEATALLVVDGEPAVVEISGSHVCVTPLRDGADEACTDLDAILPPLGP